MRKLMVIGLFYFALMINSNGQSSLFEEEYQSKIRIEQNADAKVTYYLILNNYYYEVGDFEKGDKLLAEMQEFVNVNQLPFQKGVNYYCEAIQMDNNNIGDMKTLDLLFLAIEEFEKNETELLTCNAYLFCGNILMMGLRYREEAYKYFLLALDAANKSNNYRFQALANNGVGVVLYSLGDYENSIRYLKKTLELFEQEKNFHEMENLFNNISANYLKQNVLDSAFYYVEKGIQLNNQDGSQGSPIGLLYTKAIIYLKQENFTKAQSLALQLLEKVEKNKMNSWHFQLLTLLGKISLKQEQNEKATKYLVDARRIAATIDNQLLLNQLLTTEAELYESTGDFKKSSLLYKESLLNKDSIEKEVRIGELMKLNNLYELQTIKRTNEDLSNKRRLAEKQSNHRMQIIYLLMIGAFIFVGLILILYKQKMQQTLANKLLAQKNRSLVQQVNINNKGKKTPMRKTPINSLTTRWKNSIKK